MIPQATLAPLHDHTLMAVSMPVHKAHAPTTGFRTVRSVQAAQTAMVTDQAAWFSVLENALQCAAVSACRRLLWPRIAAIHLV